MKTAKRAYLLLLFMNAAVVALAAFTALLLPAPQRQPAWLDTAWLLIALSFTALVLLYRRSLLLSGGDEAKQDEMVAALSLASLPLIWSLLAVQAFWYGRPQPGWLLLAGALALAAFGFFSQPES